MEKEQKLQAENAVKMIKDNRAKKTNEYYKAIKKSRNKQAKLRDEMDTMNKNSIKEIKEIMKYEIKKRISCIECKHSKIIPYYCSFGMFPMNPSDMGYSICNFFKES